MDEQNGVVRWCIIWFGVSTSDVSFHVKSEVRATPTNAYVFVELFISSSRDLSLLFINIAFNVSTATLVPAFEFIREKSGIFWW